MAENSGQYKIGEKEMEKLRKSSKHEKKDNKKESSGTAGSKLFRALCWIIAVAYFALLFFGKRFLPEEGTFLSSLDLFSGAEKPNHLIRIASLCILTLSISAVLRFIIATMASRFSPENSGASKTGYR